MRFINDLADGLIDFEGNLSGEVLLGIRVVSTKEDGAGVALILDWTEV